MSQINKSDNDNNNNNGYKNNDNDKLDDDDDDDDDVSIGECAKRCDKKLTIENNKVNIGQTEQMHNEAKMFLDDIVTKDFINNLIETKRRRVWCIPWFIIIICMLQIIIYAMHNIWINQHFLFTPETRKSIYPYITYMLLHSDLIHLLLNICLQCLVGVCLEGEQGHCKLAFIYAVGGISGSLVIAIVQPHLSILGASAGVYSLLVSHIPHMMKNFYSLSYRYLRVIALSILCLSDIAFTTYHFIVNNNTNPQICLMAHIAGAITGLILGFILYDNYNDNIKYTKCYKRSNKTVLIV